MQQYFPVVCLIMLYQVVPSESVDEILKCHYSIKSYGAVFFLWCCLLCRTFREFVNGLLKCDFQVKPFEQHFPVGLFVILYRVVLTFSLCIKSYKVCEKLWSFYSVLNNIESKRLEIICDY